MGKSTRSNDPFILDDQEVRQSAPKARVAAPKQTEDPFILGDGDKGLVKKKAGGADSGTPGGPTASELLSGENINKAAKAYQDKTLNVQDQDLLAQTDWGKQEGLTMPSEWKNTFVKAHNGPKTSELINSVMNVLNANYPRTDPGTPQSHVREQIFTSVQKGDIPAIQKTRNSIIDSKQQEILKIKNDPQGPQAPSGIIGQPIYVQSSVRTLSDEQKQRVKVLEDEANLAKSALDAFTAHAIVGKADHQVQLKTELSPQNIKYTDLTISAQSVGRELERTIGITKTIPNTKYEQTRAGLEAIMSSYQMDINDLMTTGMKSKNPELIKKAQEKVQELSVLQNRYLNLDNQFPDVGTYKTARYLGDILSEIKPNRLLTTTADVNEAAALAEKRNPGFLQSHGKFVQEVAKSEGDWIGVKTGMIPQGGFIGGIKGGTEGVAYGGAEFVAAPFGLTWDPKTQQQAQAFLEEPQVKGTSRAGVQPTKIVYDKENKAYREIPNEHYGSWDFNSAMYSLGKGVPTLAEWIVLDKGIGGLAKGVATVGVKGFNIVGKEIAASTNAMIGAKDLGAGYEALKVGKNVEKTAGLYGTTYITSFDENRKLADHLIEDKSSMGEAKKNALANLLTLSTAGIFSMMDYSPTKAVEAALTKSAAPDVLKFLEKNSWENLSEDGVSKLLKDQIWPRVKAVVKAAGTSAAAGAKLGVAGAVDQKIKDFASVIVNPKKAQPSSVEDNLHSFVDQVLLMTVAGLPGMVKSGAFPHTSKDALYQSGVLAPQYIDRINERAAQGDLDQAQANRMIGMVKTMAEEVDKARSTTNKDGTPLSLSQKRELAVNNFRKRAADMLSENNVIVGSEGVQKEADTNIEGILAENKWNNIEDGVPFQTARDLETGQKLGTVNDIDPKEKYTYEQDGETVTATGAELFNHLINGNYEQVKNKTGTSDEAAEGKEGKTADTPEATEIQAGETEKNVNPELLQEGKDAIEKAIQEGKLKGPYAAMARAQPEALLKDIADQAHGLLATGEPVSGGAETPELALAGQDADFAVKEQFGDDLVDVAKKLYPKESKPSPPTAVIRHAESRANAENKPNSDDTLLTAAGLRQAEKLGDKLTQEGYKDVIASQTSRTERTAEIVAEKTGGNLIENPELSKLLKEWDQTGGESIDEFAHRMAKARDGIAELPAGTAVIAHGKVMGMLEALDKTDGDIEKAKKEFDSTKVYGNTDTYIPSQKQTTNEKGNARKGDKESRQGNPEGRQKGDGKSAAVSEEGTVNRNVSQTAEGTDGEGRQKENDVLSEKGAAPETGVAPSRQARINDLIEKTNRFNKTSKNDSSKAAQLNDIRLQAKELGVKVDYGKGFASIKDEQGNKIQRRSEETNQTPAKDFDLTKYADRTKAIVNDMVASDLPLLGVSVPGFDGRIMSEKQKQQAANDIRSGNMTNGAKAMYDALDNMVAEGFVELIDPSTRQRVGVPLDDYLKAVSKEIKPLTDNDLTELNSLLGEDVFGKIFDDIFASAQTPEENEQPAKEISPIEQPAPGAAGESAPPAGGGEAGAGPGEPPKAQPEVQAEIAQEKVTGIRNVVVNSERMDRSLDPVVKEAATSFADTWATALSLVKGGNVDPRSLVNSLFADSKPKVSDVDNALILMDRIDLTNQRIELLNALEKANADNDQFSALALEQRLVDVDQKIAQNDEVSDRTGQETARALSSRRMLATLDFTLSKMTADIRRLYPDGDIPNSLVEKLKKIERDHADLLRKYADREEQWRKEQAEKTFAQEKERVTKTTTKTEKKIALKGKDLADRIRSLRPKGGGTAQANLFSLPIAVYDTAILAIAELVEQGAKVADAINQAIQDIKFDSDKDRKDFEDHITGFVENENAKANTPEALRYNLVKDIVDTAKEQGATSLVKDNITPLRKIASSYIREGLGSLDEVVDKIHADLAKDLPDLTIRQVRDAFSGYGDMKLETRNDLARQVKDLQRQAVLISQMEDVAKGMAPERGSKKPAKVSKDVQRLKIQLETDMKNAGMTWEEPPRSKDQQAQRALQSAKGRLKSEIDRLNKRIKSGALPPGRTETLWDAERKQLAEERDRLKEILAQTAGPSQLSDEMKIKRLENSLKKQIGQYEEKIKEGGGPLREKTEGPTSPDIERLKARRDALRELNRQLQVDNNPKSTPQQIALEAYKSRVKSRIETLTRRAMDGDFEPKERETLHKDAEAMKLDIALKRTESEFYTLKRKAEKENRGRIQKVLDKISAYKRFAVLSGIPSLGKIGLAVTYRTIGTPIEELVGAGLRQIPGVRQVAAQAPREGGGFSLATEGAALGEWVKAKTYQDWWEVLKKGKGELDVRAGKYAEDNPELIEIFGRIHASLKNFSKRAEFARAYEARIDYARKKGFDISDEAVQMTAIADSYIDARRSIFMQDNALTNWYFKILKQFESDKSAWQYRLGAFVARFVMPIVKVPTNFIAETGTYAFGAATGTSQIIYNAIQGNLTKLSPQEADLIMRSLKKGSIGLTLGVIGYLMPQLAGGFWQRGDKRDEEEVQAGELMFFGQRIPKWATHFPALEVMQMGATLRRVYDRKIQEEGLPPSQALPGSITAAAGGLLGEVPLFEQPTQLMERFKYGEWDKLIGDQFKSLDPQLLQNLASWMDREDGKAVKRAPENPWETFETGIPGLRENVPKK